ncbi:hypothetical protein GUJ93_ZPchr0013g35698 [Zizania palustris]|uniref:DUF4378 domain-containing protein n=1 Tax=Zizania palustris TaxID=103762 RepID=A0A8J6BXM0_ZIZPA|nr:hypothetical protein GUJ93_ZPchr0013g35698 [Zizania palustris]
MLLVLPFSVVYNTWKYIQKIFTVSFLFNSGSVLRKQASNPGILSDSMLAVENQGSKSKKASGIPMKTLIDEEFSKEVNASHTSPGVVGRLMGLDSLPSFGAYNQHKYTQRHAEKSLPCSTHGKYGFSKDIPHRRSTDEMPEIKDVFEVMEATRMKIHRSPRSKSGNATYRFDKTHSPDLDYIRQKFMDAKRLSMDESLQMSEEFNETLDALVSNKDILLEFLQKLDPIVRRDLHDYDSPSSTANSITILKASRRNQITDTANINSQYKGGESYFYKQKEVEHSQSKPYAKLPSQSPKEDSGSLRQKLSRSSHQENSDKQVSHTDIVVLKPTLGKAQDIEGAFPLRDELPRFDFRRRKPCQGDSMCTEKYIGPLRDAEILDDIIDGSRETARELIKQLSSARSSGTRKQVFKPETNTFVSDERSQFLSPLSNAKFSEAFHRSSELFDGSASSSFTSSPAYSAETKVSNEAKKHLSNRWKATQRCQHRAADSNTLSMLGDMLALSDQEASKVATQKMPNMKFSNDESQKNRMPGYGWRDVSTNTLTRLKSLPMPFNHGVQRSNNRKRTSRLNEFSMLKDVLRVGPHDSEHACHSRNRKSLMRGSAFHGDEADLVSSGNEEEMVIEREIHVNSEEPTNGVTMTDSSKQMLLYPSNRDHESDAVYYLDTTPPVPRQKNYLSSPGRQNQLMHRSPPMELDDCLVIHGLNCLVTEAEGIKQHQGDDNPAVCKCQEHAVPLARIGDHQNNNDETQWMVTPTGSGSPVSSDKDDQQSPVSVLESSLDTEDVYSGDFEKISADLEGLKMQLRLLKMEATDNADDTELVLSDDDIATASQPLPDMEISSAFRDDEERDFSYVLDMLIVLGINAANRDQLLDMCYLSECPAGPDLFDVLEDKYNAIILWPSPERKLLFDLTNSVIADIITSLMQHSSKGLSQRCLTILDQEGFIEVVWQRVVQLRQEMECAQESLTMDLGWIGSEDGIDLVASDIERMLQEDLLQETITEFLGMTKSTAITAYR